jgi:hypothetical protein
VAYYSYKQKSNIEERTVCPLIVTNGEYYTGLEDRPWAYLVARFNYADVNNDITGLDLAEYKRIYSSFKIFDKRKPKPCGAFSDYVRRHYSGDSMAENKLLTDFPRLGWRDKQEFLTVEPCFSRVDKDAIYFAALAHMWCVDYFLDVPDWIVKPVYYSKERIVMSDILERNFHPVMIRHNIFVAIEAMERV